jgi:fructose-1,6-bisphosphatase II
VTTSEGRCICQRFTVVTEGAALAAAQWLGRGDGLAADGAAREAMAAELGRLFIRGRVVAGRSGGSGPHALHVGEEVGDPSGPWFSSRPGSEGLTVDPEPWDLALDPLQAPNSLGRGADGAMTTMAAGPSGSLMPVPEMYMQKLVVPREAAGAVDLDASVEKNIKELGSALGRKPAELVVVVLDRPRHEGLVEQIRQTGARVRLILDGDVSASLAAATGDAGVDMYIGIGGSTEGIMTAAALRCLGGEIQARFWPVSRHQVELARAAGIKDIEARLSTRDLVGEGVMMVATAVTAGRYLKAVDFDSDGTRTETLIACSACHAVRKIMTIHRSDNEGPRVSLGVR